MKKRYIIGFALLGLGVQSYAQSLEADLQLRPRYEYRHGYKDFLQDQEKPASFISNRARLNLSYKNEALSVKISAQNISTWGETPIAKTKDQNAFSLYEAWANYSLNKFWDIKLGRQVLEYDNQRIFGGLDWVQQGQSHDALLFRFNQDKHLLDVGFALNNVSDALTQQPYTVANYKNMQYAWYHTRLNKVEASFLFLNTGYEYEKQPEDYEVSYMQTWGTHLKYSQDKFQITSSLYAQTGKTRNNSKEAWYAALDLNYNWSPLLSTQIGYEFLSGKRQDDQSTINKSFTPVFGTNHGFNGLMDYFYVGNHQNTVGLHDMYLKINLQKDKWSFSAQPHLFRSAGTIFNTQNEKMKTYLGSELDLTFGYQLQKDIKVSGGYSQLFASSSLESLKAHSSERNNQWAWLMISINPQLFSSNK